jgi:Raf kinase inhibitor-like YbhB/YbcL family protein
MKRSFNTLIAAAFFTSVPLMAASAFELSSPDIVDGKPMDAKFIYNSFGCTGQNVSPQLIWTDPPAGTKSFAVLVHDPDAPTGGGGFWHWLVGDIPATARGLAQGAGTGDGKSLPPGAKHWENDFGDAAWGGPCPPPGSGAHHYNITVYALEVERLDLPAKAKAAVVGYTANKNALAKATLTGRFGR